MVKILVKKVLRELGKLKEYHYPTEKCDLFLLPDGKLIGNNILTHQNMLEKILKRKIKSTQELFDIIVEIGCVRMSVNASILFVDISIKPTTEQKQTLEELGMYGKYIEIIVDNMHEYVPDAPSNNYGRRLLKLPFY